MGTEVLKRYDNLQVELDKAKSNLKGLNENIRRMIGRDVPDTASRSDRKRNFNDRRNEYNNNSTDRIRDRNQQRNDGGGGNASPLIKRRIINDNPKSVFSRLSGPPPRDYDRPKLLSRVIRELPTRQEIVAAQGTDEQSRARNRRMFGCLIGTLQKFCQEESRLKPKEEKKAKIEKKLEEQQIQERENLKKERQNLFSDRKKQQQEIKMLEFKMNRMKELTEWEESRKPLVNFIKTKTKPYIYYLPKTMDKKSKQKLDESKTTLEKVIEKKRQDVYEELQKMEGRFKNSNNATFNENPNDPKDPDDEDEDDEHNNDHEISYGFEYEHLNEQGPNHIDKIKIEVENNDQANHNISIPSVTNVNIENDKVLKGKPIIDEKPNIASSATSHTATTETTTDKVQNHENV